MGSMEPPFHTKALATDYVASYWAIIAYFLGFAQNCCGFCDWLLTWILSVDSFKHGAA